MQDLISYKREILNHYRLVLDLPAAVKQKVTAAKTRFDSFFKGTPIAGGAPLIYLASFSAYENEEEGITDQLNRIALAAMPFKIHLKGYSSLDTKEIYIRVGELPWIRELIEKISQIGVAWSNQRFNLLPRISLAKKLLPWQYERVWPYFEKEAFQNRFIVSGMLLLKQEQGMHSWQIVKHFLFENQLIRG